MLHCFASEYSVISFIPFDQIYEKFFFIELASSVVMTSTSLRGRKVTNNFQLIRGNKRPTGCKRLFFLLQNILFAQHVSGTIMPIIRSSRFIQIVAAYGTLRFGLQVVGLVWSCGLCVWFAGCCSIPQTGHITRHITHSSTPDQRPVNQSAKYHRQQPSV